MNTSISRLVVAVAAAGFATAAFAKSPIYNANITEAEVVAAQQAWGGALVQISNDFASGGIAKARATANAVLDAAYGYNMRPVLFKPTLTASPQTFRTTRDGALAYFVGGDKNFPKDTGFALKGWTKVEIQNAAIHINGDVAKTMGNVVLTDKAGNKTTVDKTWAFKKDDMGKVRIVLHHSSLPFSGS
ncbi:MAG: phosphoribosyl-AMP cyclohydrolase [Gammaproteobacteria bacterium]|nr:phosphoribosyl-AMP cyclohydrolase [Gammaproteobacteria bacterium]